MIRAVVVDDHAAVRAGLVAVLRPEPGILIRGSTADLDGALRLARTHEPDLVLADFQLADGDGLALCRRLTQLERPPRVLLYSAFATDELAVAAIVAGGQGALSKATDLDALFDGIRRAAGGALVPANLAPGAVADAGAALEDDDLAIFGLRVAGTPVAEVAETLRLERAHVEQRIDVVLGHLRQRLFGDPAPPEADTGHIQLLAGG